MSMDAMNIDRILSQMRVLSAQAAGQAPITNIPAENTFASTLKNTLGQVNDMQVTATNMQENFEKGGSGMDVAKVMIAGKKAEIAFQATVQVRNKFIDAYHDIMNMSI